MLLLGLQFYKKERAKLFKAELVCFLLDKSAGKEGFDFVPPAGGNIFGRYEIALLCLGMMHFHFGHPKLALEVSSLDILILYIGRCFYLCSILYDFFLSYAIVPLFFWTVLISFGYV